MNNGCITLPQGISPTPSPRRPRGFTLIELIVVIGIIGVLSGVLIASFSGGTDSARAAKCLNNMRSLAQGVISYGATSRAKAFPPLAGSLATIEFSGSGKVCMEKPGWISWLSLGDEYGTRRTNKQRPKSFIAIENASAYCSDREKADFAITNGTLWQAIGGNRECYVCPDHAIAAQKKRATVNWSYVMNCYFGYDSSDGGHAFTGTGSRSLTDISVRRERRLLFAELPIYGTGTPIDEGGKPMGATYPTSGDTRNDCVLQFNTSAYSIDSSRKWNGANESIAFNHKNGKRWCAHVVFADGHTEKLLKPNNNGVSKEQLTALLCHAKDIGFDGSNYSWVNSTDKSE